MKTERPHQRAAFDRRGFSLPELVLALAISTLIGATVVMMLAGLAAATKIDHDTRRACVKRQVVSVRLGAYLRSAATVLSSGDTYLVLWTGDTTGNDQPNLSELRRIEWSEDTGLVTVFEASPGLSAAADTAYDPAGNFDAITRALVGSASFPGRIRLRGVTNWVLTLDSPDPVLARVITLNVSFENESGPETVTTIAVLRASKS